MAKPKFQVVIFFGLLSICVIYSLMESVSCIPIPQHLYHQYYNQPENHGRVVRRVDPYAPSVVEVHNQILREMNTDRTEFFGSSANNRGRRDLHQRRPADDQSQGFQYQPNNYNYGASTAGHSRNRRDIIDNEIRMEAFDFDPELYGDLYTSSVVMPQINHPNLQIQDNNMGFEVEIRNPTPKPLNNNYMAPYQNPPARHTRKWNYISPERSMLIIIDNISSSGTSDLFSSNSDNPSWANMESSSSTSTTTTERSLQMNTATESSLGFPETTTSIAIIIVEYDNVPDGGDLSTYETTLETYQ